MSLILDQIISFFVSVWAELKWKRIFFNQDIYVKVKKKLSPCISFTETRRVDPGHGTRRFDPGKTSRRSDPLVQLFFLLCCCWFASYPVSLTHYGSCHKNATVLYRSFESYHIYIKRENALLEFEIEQYTIGTTC
jgi:hypothetical protein